MKIKAEVNCPQSYYEEIMKKPFNKWSKMQLVAFINFNSDENNQVTQRPRKSTLIKLAKQIEMMKFTEVKPAYWTADKVAEKLVLLMTFMFLGLIGTGAFARWMGWIG